MKIGIDARLWNETGVGRYIRSIFAYLSEYDRENEYIWFFRKKEYETIALPSKKWKKVKADIRWHTIAEQTILPALFLKENLDLLHFPYFSFPILYPKKFVVTIHDLIFDHYKTGKSSTLPLWFYAVKKVGYHAVLATSVKRATKILTLSQDAKSEIIRHYHADPAKIVVTYESGKLEDHETNFSGREFDPMRKLKPYILYVGNAHPHKNVESLVLAMKKIHTTNPDIQLVLVGNDRFFYPKLKMFIEQEKAADFVKIIGEVPNNHIAAWYHFASLFVTCSKMEGFGIPPLEAMSVECPVAVSDIPVFHEVCGDAAVFFDQNNPENIASTILKTIDDPGILKSLVAKGKKQAALYDWRKTVQETLAVYKAAL